MKQLKIDIHLENNSKNALEVDLFVDQTQLLNSSNLCTQASILFDYDDTAIIKHQFQLMIKGKRSLIDHVNDVDAAVILNSLNFNGINILPAVVMTYAHNGNGFTDTVAEQYQQNDMNLFYGFDGTVSFEFFTPLSYWLISEYPF